MTGSGPRFCPNTAPPAVKPPSTTIAVPVTHSESSLARNSAIAAMSCGCPARGIGWISARNCYATCSPPGRRVFISGVLIPPGQIQLTRIRSLPTSRATERVRLMTAAFAAL